jgi:hypothetical protein
MSFQRCVGAQLRARTGGCRYRARTAPPDLHALAGDGEHGDVGHDDQVAGEDQLVARARLLHLLVAQHDLHRARQAARGHLVPPARARALSAREYLVMPQPQSARHQHQPLHREVLIKPSAVC